MLDQILQELPRFFSYYNLLFFAKALGVTFALSAIGCVVGLSLGFLLAAVRLDTRPAGRPLRVASTVFIELFRRIPFLVTLMLVFFIFQGLNADLAMFTVALISVCLIATAFIAEIVRAGIMSVHKGQMEAGSSLGLSRGQTLRLIVVPQAMRVILPPLTNQYLNLTKNSSLAVAIGYPDLVSVFAGTTLSQTGQAIEIISITMGVYLLISLITSAIMSLYGFRLDRSMNR